MSNAHPHGRPDPMTCDQLRELAPDLALDLLDGADRAVALAHVEGCTSCHTEVARLTETAHETLLLAPELEPPDGFDGRVLDALAAAAPQSVTPSPTRSRRSSPWGRWGLRTRRPAVLVAAAALGLALAGVATAVITNRAGDDPWSASAPMITDGGESVGWAVLEDGDPSELYVDLSGWADAWDDYDQLTAGQWSLAVDIGEHRSDTYPLAIESPTAELTLDNVDVTEVTSIALVDDDGRPWCRASFGTS